jgi:MFS family permease
MAKKLEWIVACALTALALALHVSHFLHAGALWRDEAAAVALATQPSLGAVFESFPHEAFPLAFPLAVRAWVAMTGGSDVALRVFGLLVGLGILAALWWNAWRVRRRPPLVSLALLAASPSLFLLGDSIRGYGLGTLFLLLTFGALANSFLRPSRNGRLAALAFALLAVHSLIPGWPLLGALCVAAAVVHLWRRRFREAALVIGIGAVAALSLLPYAGPLSRARDWNVVVRSPAPVSAETLWDGLVEVASTPLPALRWAWLLAAGLAVFAGYRKIRFGGLALEVEPEAEPEGEPARDLALFTLLTIFLGTAACLLFLAVLDYDPRPWYYLPLLVLLGSAFDLAIPGFTVDLERRLGVAAGALGALLALLALGVGGVLVLPAWRAAAVRQTNVDLVAEAVNRAVEPGDLVLVNPWYDGISFARYYRARVPWLTLPEITDHRFHRYDLLKSRLAAPRAIDDVMEAVGASLATGHRVWVVGGLHFMRSGRPVPALPPAPGTHWGWFDVPYEVVWSRQAGAFLQAHARQVGEVQVPVTGPVSDYEHLKLLVFSGWR